jgi:hypothetical protein
MTLPEVLHQVERGCEHAPSTEGGDFMEAHENQWEANLSSRAGETLDFAVAGKWIKLKQRGLRGGRGGGGDPL